jgi:proton glutamate symport protein
LNVSLERFAFGRWLTVATLVALAGGLTLGTLAPNASSGPLGPLVDAIEALGAAWVRALRMIVLPLVFSLLVLAVLGIRERGGVARMGGAAIGVFFAIYIALAALTALLFPVLTRAMGVHRGAVTALRARAVGGAPVGPGEIDLADWLVELIPTNPFAAAAEENIVQIVVFAILFALAVGRLAPAARELVTGFFDPVAEAMLVIVSWLMRVSPVAVFALAFSAAGEIGLEAAWILLAFALITTIVMLLATAGLTPVAGILGRAGTLRFARAAWPGQLVAVSTRSSLASLPVLIEGARSRLSLPDRVMGFGLPFAASTFKPNRLVSSPGKLLFLAWIYGVTVEPLGYVLFVSYVMLLAATTIGVPNQGGRMTTVPLYLAMGIPVEGVVLIQSVDLLWDFAATVLNTTGYLAATTLLPRGREIVPRAEPAPEPIV